MYLLNKKYFIAPNFLNTLNTKPKMSHNVVYAF